MNDKEIINLYVDRLESAIVMTDEKYGNYLNRVIYNILRSESDTEEIKNDTYMGAWNAIPPTIPKSLKYFLVKIARNLSLDRLEYITAGKRKSIIVEIDDAIPDTCNTPEEAWELKEVGMAVNDFLGTIDQKTCAVFLARYYYGYSISDLAKRYGMTQRQVKYTLQKTRDKLRIYLKKEGVVL
ncbi:MAG: sigma-70 family RNA polymerase sigma factor [Eubacteriales bacterium]|nr:sigma-70 family RNA polymerase sigma factor [Eubacteriales bacterium]